MWRSSNWSGATRLWGYQALGMNDLAPARAGVREYLELDCLPRELLSIVYSGCAPRAREGSLPCPNTRWAVSSLLLIIGVSACVVVAPRHDYPKEYPLAESFGACPNLNGTFENAGARLSEAASPPNGPILLSSLLLAPGGYSIGCARDKFADARSRTGLASG